MPLNPGVKKTQARDHQGNILLYETTASMVSEEPDRRFVDRVEKTLLASLSEKKVQLEALAQVYAELVLIAQSADALILDEDRRAAMEILSSSVDDLALLTSNIDQLLEIANHGVVVNGIAAEDEEPQAQYVLYIDDTDPQNIQVKARLIEE